MHVIKCNSRSFQKVMRNCIDSNKSLLNTGDTYSIYVRYPEGTKYIETLKTVDGKDGTLYNVRMHSSFYLGDQEYPMIVLYYIRMETLGG